MLMTRTTLALIALLTPLVAASTAGAQTRAAWGRVALFGNGATTVPPARSAS
jgi:multidrug efflux pump subunit AcrB